MLLHIKEATHDPSERPAAHPALGRSPARRCLLLPPDHLADQSARIRKAIPPLIKQELVQEKQTTDQTKVWREEGEDRFALIITDVGREKIGVSLPTEDQPSTESGALATSPAPEPKTSKIAQVLNLLRRETGASLDELVATTGWLPHTTRAALTGLRKKGHAIDRRTVGGVSRYVLVAGAAQ